MLKTTLREEENTLIMTFEGKLDTPVLSQVEQDMKVLFDSEDQIFRKFHTYQVIFT